MSIKLHRKYLKATHTIGNLYINGVFFCNTLEDPNRDLNKNGKFDNGEKKVYGNTCIPFGIYEVIITYSNKFKRDLPLLLNVPSFEGIRIHAGNTTEATLGCILVGENKEVGKVLNSRKYEAELTSLIKKAKAKGEKVWIQII